MRTLEELKKALALAIRTKEKDLAALAETVWKNPETGFHEYKTAALAITELRKLGLPVEEKIALTGFKATLASGSPGPCVALFGEMDALIVPDHPACNPETGAAHACGHHTHIVSMLGAAMGLCAIHAEKEISGKILFLGTPAEECGEMEFRLDMIRSGHLGFLGGKQEMIRENALSECDIGIMTHVGSSPGCVAVDTNGFVKKIVTFHGRSCHASTPWKGINALNAATLAMNALAMLREQFQENEGIRLHGILTHGGEAVNVIPSDVRIEYQIRAGKMSVVRKVSALFDRAVRGAASAVGAKAEILTVPGYLPMKNNRALYDIFRREALRFLPDSGPDSPRGIEFNPICTDMGDASALMPGIHPYWPGSTGNAHAKDFRVPDPGKVCVEMATVMAETVLELLYGNAAKGRSIAREKRRMLSREKYLDLMKKTEKI